MENEKLKTSLPNRREVFRKSAIKIMESRANVFELQKKLFYGTVTENVLLSVCQDLTPKDYDVVVIERNSESICGFPLCDTNLQRNLRKDSYAKIEEKLCGSDMAKYFCSQICHSESQYLRNQLIEDPLYVRSGRSKIKLFLLGNKNSTVPKSKPTQLINNEDLVDVTPVFSVVEHPPEPSGEDSDSNSVEPNEGKGCRSQLESQYNFKEAACLIEGAPVKTNSRDLSKAVLNNNQFNSSNNQEVHTDIGKFNHDDFDVLTPCLEPPCNHKLSLFGRVWNILSSLVTRETVNFLNTSHISTKKVLICESGDLIKTKDIFCRHIFTTIKKILLANGVEIDIFDDVVTLIDTLSIRQGSELILIDPDRTCLASILLMYLANKIEYLGTLFERKSSISNTTVRGNIVSSSGIDPLQMSIMMQLFNSF